MVEIISVHDWCLEITSSGRPATHLMVFMAWGCTPDTELYLPNFIVLPKFHPGDPWSVFFQGCPPACPCIMGNTSQSTEIDLFGRKISFPTTYPGLEPRLQRCKADTLEVSQGNPRLLPFRSLSQHLWPLRARLLLSHLDQLLLCLRFFFVTFFHITFTVVERPKTLFKMWATQSSDPTLWWHNTGVDPTAATSVMRDVNSSQNT